MYNLLQFLKSIADLFCEVVELVNSFQRYIDTISSLKDQYMRVNGYKCEICPKVVDVDFHKIRFPSGWFSLEYLVEGNDLEELHFCSPGCLGLWVREYRAEGIEPYKPTMIDTGGPVIALSDEEYKRRFGNEGKV